MPAPLDRADVVFAGGGVKALALVGAFEYATNLGIRWQRFAGTSAGAVLAVLAAAGYEVGEIRRLIADDLDFRKARERGVAGYLPYLGNFLRLWRHRGLYSGQYLEDWLRRRLEQRRVRSFADLQAARGIACKVVCADLTRAKLVVFPDDAPRYGHGADTLDVALVVRMSCSLPIFFRPVEFEGSTFVDGGILRNFPIDIFDVSPDQTPRWPTIGFRLVDPDSRRPERTRHVLGYLKAIFSTMHDAHAPQPASDGIRTIQIPTLGVKTMDLGLSSDAKEALFKAGRDAAEVFFLTWDYERYLRRHARTQAVPIAPSTPGAHGAD